MIIKKIIETGVDIYNCISFCADPDSLINILRHKFVNRCIRGCYVLEVLRIVRRGECVICQGSDASSGSVSVQFEVRAICYVPGDIITGCEVTQAISGMILCDTPITSIFIHSTSLFESISAKQIITVRVIESQYAPDTDKLAVLASVYTPARETILYCSTPTDDITDDVLADVRERIADEEAAMQELANTPGWKFYAALLAPAAGKPGTDIGKLKLSPGEYVTRDRTVDLTTSTAAVVTAPSPAGRIVNAAPNMIRLYLLSDYCDHLRVIREMTMIYDVDKMQKHKNLWLIYNKSKSAV